MCKVCEGNEGLGNIPPKDGEMTHIGGYLGHDWVCGDLYRKSVSGAVVVVAT